MKKLLTILSFVLLATVKSFAQEGDEPPPPPPPEQAGKLQQRMTEYIQKRLSMTDGEVKKFRPVFLRYLLQLRKTHQEFKGDRPLLQLKIAELRVKARDEFKEVLNEQRANQVFEIQRDFEIKVREELKNRRMERRGGGGMRRINFIRPAPREPVYNN